MVTPQKKARGSLGRASRGEAVKGRATLTRGVIVMNRRGKGRRMQRMMTMATMGIRMTPHHLRGWIVMKET